MYNEDSIPTLIREDGGKVYADGGRLISRKREIEVERARDVVQRKRYVSLGGKPSLRNRFGFWVEGVRIWARIRLYWLFG